MHIYVASKMQILCTFIARTPKPNDVNLWNNAECRSEQIAILGNNGEVLSNVSCWSQSVTTTIGNDKKLCYHRRDVSQTLVSCRDKVYNKSI